MYDAILWNDGTWSPIKGGSNMVPIPNLTGGSSGGSDATSGAGNTYFGDVTKGINPIFLYAIGAIALIVFLKRKK